ncbi:MAG: tRNA uridine-5-carboxymethylaminomethyl(34) synthesis GTPase MnmE [Bdellovibrionales bacterium]
MSAFQTSTIVALASAAGKAGVAVIRLSGPHAREALLKIGIPSELPSPRKVSLRDLVDDRTKELIDHALVVFFPAPHSFTGEDVVELHVHGGRSIIYSVVEQLCTYPGIRPAEPGEFSRRAYENGKMDLTEAEGIADLVDAETAAQRRQALRQMDGELGRLYTGWAERLTHNLAYIEAEIDFADEEIPSDISEGRRESIAQLAQEIDKHLNDNHRGERLREGFTVALLGAPNAGKSSLLNALARREAAIVSPLPGTTRDIIEVQLDLGGYPVTLADTAGLRETADAIESEGVRRALARAEQADLKILVFDGSVSSPADETTLSLIDDSALLVINKSDLASFKIQEPSLPVSAQTGEGLETLIQKLIEEIEKRFTGNAGPALTRVRHRVALQECQDHLRRALAAPQIELCAEDLRLAVRALGRITGTVDVEELLDVIFSSFCIGK